MVFVSSQASLRDTYVNNTFTNHDLGFQAKAAIIDRRVLGKGLQIFGSIMSYDLESGLHALPFRTEHNI